MAEASIEDLVGDATSAIEESIKDEVGDSRISVSKMSKHSRDNSASDMKQVAGGRASVSESKADKMLLEIEKKIDQGRSEREEKLARDLKKRRISPRSYDKGIREIEKWVVSEKRELYQRRRKLEESDRDMDKYLKRFMKDKQTVPMLTKIASPRPDSALMSYGVEDSQNSDKVQAAMREAHLMQKELTGMSPD